MADPLSVAGLAAGLISLGLQVTGGITQYLDALKCRSEELDSARKHNDSLRSAIAIIQASVAQAQAQHHAASQIVIGSIQQCEAEIQSLEELVAELAGCDTGTWRSKLRLNSKKLRYAFDRSKLQRLELRLSQAKDTVDTAMQTLGVNINQSILDKTTDIEIVTREIPSDLLAIKLNIDSLHPSLARLGERFSTVEREVGHLRSNITTSDQTMTAHLLETTRAIREDNKIIQTLVSVSDTRSNDLLVQIAHQDTEQRQLLHSILQMMEKQARPINVGSVKKKKQPRTRDHMVLGFTEKSSDLPHISYRPGGENGAQGISISQSERHRGTTCDPTLTIRKTSTHLVDPTDPPSCICNKRNRIVSQTVLSIGDFTWYRKEYRGHWPSCPQSRTAANKTLDAVGVRYHGLLGILKHAVDLSFVLRRGSGRLGFNPIIDFRPTVDIDTDPVFRIFDLLLDLNDWGMCSFPGPTRLFEFILKCKTRVLQAFRENRSSPFAIDSRNNTIGHKFIHMVSADLFL
ncbi:hypothetical protein PG999_014075 [Apiospora kogelbergensis]|uniref:Fungal N-terminal domain-containing protein n=1 Tax=Apiospora kogelbergensis TaxID=1337665 RepID=A0AAW0Q782_9PEZI